MQNNAKAQDIFHLGHSIGIDMSFKDAEKISTGIKPDTVKDEKLYLINNFRNALEFNRSNIADTYPEFDFTIILHLNKLILTSWRETWEARLRNVSDEQNFKDDNWETLRDTSVDTSQVENHVIDLIEWYKLNSQVIAPIVRIGILLYRLIEIYPFVAGNKITFLALCDYLLLKYGLSSKAFFSVVRSIDVNEEILFESYKTSKKANDLIFWLETFTYILIKQLIEVKEQLSSYLEEDEKTKSQPFLDLNKRQIKILRYLQNVPVIKREDYCHMMDVSTMTAFRDLSELVRKKLLKVEGRGRGTKYRLSTM